MIELKKSPVIFNEDEHTYWLNGVQLKGVTSSLIHRAFPDKYKDVDPEVLANAARKGKELHALIEYHDTFGTSADEHDDPRVAAYERLKSEHGLKTIANEYLVSDEEHYASSIDVVMVNNSNEICLVDIKTTWSLDRQSTALQLSIYKRFFERQNPGLKVTWLFALWMPNRDYSLSDMLCLQEVNGTVIDNLIQADLQDQAFDITASCSSLPARLNEVEDEIIRVEQQLKDLKLWEDNLKLGLYALMEESDIKSFRSASKRILLTRVLPTETETFDTKRFKEEHPDLYKEYTKTSTRKGSLKITIS